jgi:hypothetical protein
MRQQLVKKFESDKIAATVADTLRRHFESIKIVRVDVARDQDHEGEEILRIQVVFDGVVKAKDAASIAGAARYLRPALEKIDADIFPLLSFVSKLDYERGRGREAV